VAETFISLGPLQHRQQANERSSLMQLYLQGNVFILAGKIRSLKDEQMSGSNQAALPWAGSAQPGGLEAS
jgi:hypothetical protein